MMDLCAVFVLIGENKNEVIKRRLVASVHTLRSWNQVPSVTRSLENQLIQPLTERERGQVPAS